MTNHNEDRIFTPGYLHVGKPNIGNRADILRRINGVLDTHRLTNHGPLVRELEQRIADYHQVKHCVATCNGTVALGMALRALGITGEAIVPSFTFVATAHALLWQGIKPVFCDIDPVTANLDPNQVERLITAKTTGIIGVHLWGRPCAPNDLTHIARQRGLKLVFDAAHAFGCSCQGRMIGSFGDAEVLSFHATKVFNTAEGGAVLTNNSELADRLRYIRNFGFAGYDNVTQLGVNGKMNELCAALGLANLEDIETFIACNQRNYLEYRSLIGNLTGLELLAYNSAEKNNWQYVIAMIDEKRSRVSRDDLVALLHRHRILARRYFWPGCHRMEPYRTLFPHAGERLKQTETIADKVIVLPTGSGVNEADIHRICGIIAAAVTKTDT